MGFNPDKYIGKEVGLTDCNPEHLTKIERVIKRIEAKKIDIAPDYADWVKIGFAISSELGESGRGYFHGISKFHLGYNINESDKQYSDCLKGKK